MIDPLVGIDFPAITINQKVPIGNYPVTLSILNDSLMGIRYAAAKITFSDNPTVRIEHAKSQDGADYWVDVDTGLAGIFDLQAFEAMAKFNKDKTQVDQDYNIYDSYFQDLLMESYLKNPSFQRESGDYLNLKVPDTDLSASIFASGYGDGSYRAYIGFDSSGNLTAVYIHFIDIDIEFSDD